MERRDFVKLSLLGVTASLLLGCKTSGEPLYKTYIKDINTDPLFRAATLKIDDKNNIGHAALISENGFFRIYTIEHVIKYLHDPLELTIPGVGNYSLARKDFSILLRATGEYEGADFINPRGKLSTALDEAVKGRILQPLVLTSEKPKEGELVAVANSITGNYDTFLYKYYEEVRNLLHFERVENNVFCGGQSGSPLLKMLNGKPTNQVYGFLSNFATESLIDDPNGVLGLSCGWQGRARANQ